MAQPKISPLSFVVAWGVVIAPPEGFWFGDFISQTSVCLCQFRECPKEWAKAFFFLATEITEFSEKKTQKLGKFRG